MNLENNKNLTFYQPSFKKAIKVGLSCVADTHFNNMIPVLAALEEKIKSNPHNIFLHAGDLGDLIKGVHPSEFIINSILEYKKKFPETKMVFTIGNNDISTDKGRYDFFKDIVKLFDEKGINVVCFNIFDKNNLIEGVKPYTIVKKSGKKIFITGCCCPPATNGIDYKNPLEVIEKIKEYIRKEKPDSIILLSHEEKNLAQKVARELNADAAIQGHYHQAYIDKENNTLAPPHFSRGAITATAVIDKGRTTIEDPTYIYPNSKQKVDPAYIELYKNHKVVKRGGHEILSSPFHFEDSAGKLSSSTGSFVADAMKEKAKAEIGFFSIGFVHEGFSLKEKITKDKIREFMPAPNSIRTKELDIKSLKETLNNAFRDMRNNRKNMLHLSSNIKIEMEENTHNKTFKITRIYINDEKLLDEAGEPINSSRKITCAFDGWIGNGARNFKELTNSEHVTFKNGRYINMRDAFLKKLFSYTNSENSNYPCAEIIVHEGLSP